MVDEGKYVKKTLKKLEEENEVTILALGDSFTAGWAVERGFVSFFYEMLSEKFPDAKINIINAGIPGDTAEGGLVRLDSLLVNDPDLVTINFGGNDMFGVSEKSFENTMNKIIDKIKEGEKRDILILNIAIFSIGIKDLVQVFNKVIERVARKKGAGLVDVHGAWKKKIKDGLKLESLITWDEIHPNESGHKIIAQELMSFFD